MANNFFNRLKIIGEYDQVKQIIEFLIGESDETNKKRLINFNKIFKIPKRIRYRK